MGPVLGSRLGSPAQMAHLGGETLAQLQVVSTSVPQGDPCAPAAFTLLLQQGADELREALQGDSCHAQFVDDRNVIVFSPQDVLRTLAHWASWCERLGLKENLVKAKIVPHDPASAHALREAGVDSSLLHTEARVLGVDFRQEGGLGATAEKRREQGTSILSRVACAPVSFVKKEVLASTRVTALVGWGVWLGPFPQSEAFTTKLKRAVGAHANGSRHLWQLLSGPWTDPGFYSVLASFGALARGISFWRRHGILHTGGRWLQCLVESLQGLGFVRSGQDFVHSAGRFCWPPPAANRLFKGWLKRSAHLLREAWRMHRFSQFLHNPKRHDAAALRAATQYDEKQVAAARALWRKFGAEGRGVLVGAAHSVAEYACIKGLPMPRVCCYCFHDVVPSWEHLAWRCAHFSASRPHGLPADGLTRRLGWPRRPFHARRDFSTLEFMAQVRETVRVDAGMRA